VKPYYGALAAGVVAVSFAAVFIKQAEAPSIVIAAARLSLAALVVAPVALVKARAELKKFAPKEYLLAAASGSFLALHFALWITSLRYATVTSSVALVTASPIFVAIMSWLLFKEKITRRILLGISISIVGAVTIGFNSWILGGASVKGSILALSGALAMAGYLFIGRRLRQRMGTLSYVFLTYTTAAIVLLIWAFAVGGSFTGYSGLTYLMFVLLALVPQLMGHSLLNWSLKYVPATMVTLAELGEPVGATILAFAVLSEVPTGFEIAGGLLILGGIALAFSGKERS